MIIICSFCFIFAKKRFMDKKNNNIDSENISSSSQKPDDTSKIEITVKRHEQLFELLKDPVRMWRVLLSLFLIISILFIGLAFVVTSIKRFYPYNMIETNIQGASIVKTEDKDVIYWLFNTADLWANSGIDVKEGDILTIRASGSSFTAIHHLVDASMKNKAPQDKWVGTEGQHLDHPRDVLRTKYRLCKDVLEGILLMKIIPQDSTYKDLKEWGDSLLTQDIEVIGKERTLYVSKSGVLHFAVNDIVLTTNTLNKMYHDYIDSISHLSDSIEKNKKQITQFFDSITGKDEKKDSILIQSFIKNHYIDTTIKVLAKQTGLQLGSYPEFDNRIFHDYYPIINELVYYKEKKFIEAWYMDNLGSFLIVIERKRK